MCIFVIPKRNKLKNKAMTNLATLSKEELGTFLAPLIDLSSKMILAGVLKKNVIKHFTNKGLSFEAAENITDCGVFKAEEFLKNKAK
jgi:hypothetical protein